MKLKSIKTIKDLEGKTLTDFVDWDLSYHYYWEDEGCSVPVVDCIGSENWDKYIKKWEEDNFFNLECWDRNLKKLKRDVEKVMTSDRIEIEIPDKVVDLTLEIIDKYWEGSEKNGDIIIPWKKGNVYTYTDKDYIEIGLGILRDCVYHYNHYDEILEDVTDSLPEFEPDYGYDWD